MSAASRSWLRWPLLLLTAALLSACGFHLRTSANLPFKSIYMTFGATSPLGVELKRNILASGNTVVLPTEEGAEATLQVLAETREKVVLILNSQGRASEYLLYYKLTFRVLDANKKELLPPTQITLKRDISYNSSQELSKAAEEVLLYRDMQTDMVQQILRRLAAIKSGVPTQVEPSEQPPAGNQADQQATPAPAAAPAVK
ncbi:LPS assembly lipoprotein LptE [Collimonas arenae]|uniref:LPS-assembly lipoprotein LptE n=1 Tax=Collimonas arenae TaxID=279058 RepID=UPI002FF7C66B